MRKRALLAFSLPLAAAGTLAGHAAGYAIVGSTHQDKLAHGYLGYAPEFMAMCVALLALSLGLRVSGRLQGRPAPWPFALIPPLAFVAQELIERFVAGLPAHAVLEPAVYVGLAAQVPLAAAAFLAARALLRVADEAGRALAQRPALALRPTLLPLTAPVAAPVRALFAADRPARGPPVR